jgi:alpha-1,3-glucan synthase
MIIHFTLSCQTLSRLHVCATLAFSQILGSICVMVARATAPNRIGPESVFPDAGAWDFKDGLSGSPMASPVFWVALCCQLIIVFGYFWFYRKEQLGTLKSLRNMRFRYTNLCSP